MPRVVFFPAGSRSAKIDLLVSILPAVTAKTTATFGAKEKGHPSILRLAYRIDTRQVRCNASGIKTTSKTLCELSSTTRHV